MPPGPRERPTPAEGPPDAAGGTVRHLLLDADGVLQHVGGQGWRDEIRARLGEQTERFVRAVDEHEAPALRGEGEFPAPLADALADFGLDLDVEVLYAALWESVTVDEAVLQLALDIRRTGTPVHLATNQHPRRARLMQQDLGYDDLLGRGFYSCEVGAAKPDPAFFEAVLDRLAVPPHDVAFVDDSERNVAAAARLGIRAVHWQLGEGLGELRSRLSAAGVTLPA